MDKQQEQQDRHLQSPGEANRDKHINFVAIESGDPDPADEDTTKIYDAEKNTPTPDKAQSDKTGSVTEKEDLREGQADSRPGSNRGSSNERNA